VERPPESRPTKERDLILFDNIWEAYFRPIVDERGLTPIEKHRAKWIFIEIAQNRKARGWSSRKIIEAAQDAIGPYIKPRHRENWVEKCDFCGRPHVDNKSQCPGCGVWRKQYR
jgi:rubrerythrin